MTSDASTITPLAECSADRPARDVLDQPTRGPRFAHSPVPASRRATALRCERSRLAAAGTSPGHGQHRGDSSARTPLAPLQLSGSDRGHPEAHPELVRSAWSDASNLAIMPASNLRWSVCRVRKPIAGRSVSARRQGVGYERGPVGRSYSTRSTGCPSPQSYALSLPDSVKPHLA
jgi:hypothetical protein